MAEVKRATMLVEIELPEGGEFTEHPNGTKHAWAMSTRSLVVEYVWETRVGYWRAMQSTIRGLPVYGPCPDEYTYERQDPNKPLWVAVLELNYYPKGTQWSRSTHVGR